jgi:dihydrodipicolinate synthase/N-acetylneuraminate lyase
VPDIAWRGVFAVLVTPFREDLSLDLDALRRQVDFCVDCGVPAVVGPVIASEFFTLADTERVDFYRAVADRLRGRAHYVAGVSASSAPHASALAVAATDAGADALIAMPPILGGRDKARTFDYFQAIAAASPLPLMVQNAPEPIGAPLSTPDLIALIETVPSIQAVKEETMPNPQRVGALVRAAGPRLQGVIGGLGGIYLFNELARGATGTMPACQFADVVVKILALVDAGETAEARTVFGALQPALVMERLYGMTFMKACLERRGVLTRRVPRVVEPPLDAIDEAELDAVWADLAPHFTVHP